MPDAPIAPVPAVDDDAAQMRALCAALRLENADFERRLVERAAELEIANQDLESFTYSVAHDLRAPLRAVHAFSNILAREHAAELTPEAQRVLDFVVTNAQRMEQLIEALLRLSRLGQKPLAKQPVNISALVEAVLEDLRKEQGDGGVEVKIGQLPPALGDASLLRQVFVELLSNAFKFSRKKAHPVVEVDSHDLEGAQVFFVRDNGAGFDHRYAGKLFGVFQRLHSAQEFEGAGVGLSLARRIVLRHGGRIWAESEVDKGATFYFALPR
jgi:light-regulated signal transduction histidine kinase (bacteriophytochrome)